MRDFASLPLIATVPAVQLRKIFDHAAAHEAEVCGVLVGRWQPRLQIAQALPGRNVHSTPRQHFLLDATTLLHADHTARERGGEIVGFYHSHPHGIAMPSMQDRRDAWPEHLMLIVGGARPPHLSAWLVAGGRLRPLVIMPLPHETAD